MGGILTSLTLTVQQAEAGVPERIQHRLFNDLNGEAYEKAIKNAYHHWVEFNKVETKVSDGFENCWARTRKQLWSEFAHGNPPPNLQYADMPPRNPWEVYRFLADRGEGLVGRVPVKEFTKLYRRLGEELRYAAGAVLKGAGLDAEELLSFDPDPLPHNLAEASRFVRLIKDMRVRAKHEALQVLVTALGPQDPRTRTARAQLEELKRETQ